MKSIVFWLLLIGGRCGVLGCEDRWGLPGCYNALVLEGSLCQTAFCPECTQAHACDTYCGYCDLLPLTRDCNGRLAPSAWIQDTFCDDGHYMFDSSLVNFNCEQYKCDGGDCDSSSSDICSPLLEDTESTEVAIKDIQFRQDRTNDILTLTFDCFRSELYSETVAIEGVITLIVFGEGFFMQDENAKWSGIFVNTDDFALLEILEIGQGLRVVGSVDERLGKTQILSDSIELLSIEQNDFVVSPLTLGTQSLGDDYHKRSTSLDDQSCREEIEQYESVLISLENVTVRGKPDAYNRLPILTSYGSTALIDLKTFDLNAYLQQGLHCDDCSGVTIDSLRGILSDGYKCTESEYIRCFTIQGFRFAPILYLRDAFDVKNVALADASIAPPDDEEENSLLISDVQSQYFEDTEDTPCSAPSIYIDTMLELRGIVTAIDGAHGFYMQDRPLPFSGIYVITYNASIPALGTEIIASGHIVEIQGRTIIEAVRISSPLTSTHDTLPLTIHTGLSTSFEKEPSLCLEGYESLLVKVENVHISVPRDTNFGALPFTFGSLYSGLLDDQLDQTLKYRIGLHGATVSSVTGIIRYVAKCASDDIEACLDGRADFYYAFVLSPRDANDLIGLDLIDSTGIDNSHQDAGGSSDTTEDDSSASENKKKQRDAIFILVLISLLFSLLVASTYARHERNRANLRLMAQRLPSSQLEIPMAQAMEIHTASVQVIEDDCVPPPDAIPSTSSATSSSWGGLMVGNGARVAPTRNPTPGQDPGGNPAEEEEEEKKDECVQPKPPGSPEIEI